MYCIHLCTTLYNTSNSTAWNSSVPSQVRTRRKDSFQIETASKPTGEESICNKQQKLSIFQCFTNDLISKQHVGASQTLIPRWLVTSKEQIETPFTIACFGKLLQTKVVRCQRHHQNGEKEYIVWEPKIYGSLLTSSTKRTCKQQISPVTCVAHPGRHQTSSQGVHSSRHGT